MIDFLLNVDEQVFLSLNGLHADWLDPVMKGVTGKLVWAPFYLALACMLVMEYGWKRGLLMVAAIGAAVALADSTCSKLIRPFFERLRPANPDNPISPLVHIVNGYRGGRYGFPSCHAANAFTLATAVSLMARSKWLAAFMYAWAALLCYSRIYLGVHYPGDLLAGAMVGSAYGLLAWLAMRKIAASAHERNCKFQPWHIPIFIGAATILCILSASLLSAF